MVNPLRIIYGVGISVLAGLALYEPQKAPIQEARIETIAKDFSHLIGEPTRIQGDDVVVSLGSIKRIAPYINIGNIRMDSLEAYIPLNRALELIDMFPTRLKELKQRRDSLNGLGLE